MPRLIHAYFLDTAKWCSLQDRMTSLTKQNCSLVSGTLRNANGVLLYLFESMLKFNVRKGKFFLYSTCTSIFSMGFFIVMDEVLKMYGTNNKDYCNSIIWLYFDFIEQKTQSRIQKMALNYSDCAHRYLHWYFEP